jgi:hypothetical protein
VQDWRAALGTQAISAESAILKVNPAVVQRRPVLDRVSRRSGPDPAL